MAAVGLGKTRNKAAQIAFGEPVWQALLEHAPARAPDASHDNHSAVAASERGLKETTENGATACLRVAVQIECCSDVELAAAHPLFATAIRWRYRFRRLRRRRARAACNWCWRCGLALHAERTLAGLARLYGLGDAPPERPLFAA